MTKKSLARQARDAEKKKQAKGMREFNDSVKDNKSWDELEGIYQSAVELLHSHTNLAGFATNKDLLSQVTDKPTLVANMQQLTGDLNVLSEELKQIHARHEGKAGGAKTPNDFLAAVEIFELYNLFMEKHQAVVIPTAMYITEQLEQAENKLAQLAATSADGTVAIEVEDSEQASLVEKSNAAIAAGDVIDVEVKEQSNG